MNIENILVGDNPAIKRLRKEIPQLAKLQKPILLKGDIGTGRGTTARLIHESSSPKGQLVSFNPQQVTDIEMNESLCTPNADASMYFLGEIADYSYLHQAQIHRFIQQLPKKPYIQVIVTARKAIGELRKESKLIEELAELLKGFETVVVPPLSQRVGDIPLLVEHFIKNACENIGAKMKVIDINTMDFLIRREWKENVRELKFVIERSVFTSTGDTLELPESLIDEYSQLEGIISNIKVRKAFSFDKSLYNLEKTLIERTLDTVGFNQSRAAQMLNLSEANLRYRLKKFHIPTSKDKR